jgi:phosphoglycolate phosphatase-like HAD superfamily hydrolase
MSNAMTTLVLFDIDGTLVHTGGAGVRGLTTAFREIHRHDNALAGVPVSGRTDRAILAEACQRCALDLTADMLAELREAYLLQLQVEMTRPPNGPMGVLPGVTRLIETLTKLPRVHVGLLTGNFERGAEIKLQHFALWKKFTFGAFGDDHLDRRDLVPLARERAMRAGIEADFSRVVIIGDTPLDVDCAHAHGALAIAVATGEYDEVELREAGADIVVRTLEDVPPFEDWMDALRA